MQVGRRAGAKPLVQGMQVRPAQRMTCPVRGFWRKPVRPEVDFGRDHLLGSQLAITLAYGWSNDAPMKREDVLRGFPERREDVAPSDEAPVADVRPD